MDVSWFRLWDRRKRVGILITISLVSLTALCFLPRIPLGSSYHDFADKRPIWGIPNGLDVLSNLPFVFVGVWGVAWLFLKSTAATFADPRERLPYIVFFAGVALTGAGSFWYHLAPGDSRLPWDLLSVRSWNESTSGPDSQFSFLCFFWGWQAWSIGIAPAIIASICLCNFSRRFYWLPSLFFSRQSTPIRIFYWLHSSSMSQRNFLKSMTSKYTHSAGLSADTRLSMSLLHCPVFGFSWC
jgi:hypothetical protein